MRQLSALAPRVPELAALLPTRFEQGHGRAVRGDGKCDRLADAALFPQLRSKSKQSAVPVGSCDDQTGLAPVCRENALIKLMPVPEPGPSLWLVSPPRSLRPRQGRARALAVTAPHISLDYLLHR